MGFRAWIEEYWNADCHAPVGLDAITYFLNWLKKKKVVVDSEGKNIYLECLDKHKANKTVQMCFESAWREYQASAHLEKEGKVVLFQQEEIVEPVTLHVKKYLKGPHEDGEREENDTIAVRKFVTAPATVSLKMGLTRDQGGFESARVDVSLSLPCYAEEIPDASQLVEKFVSVKLLNEFKVLEGKEDEREAEPDLFIGVDNDTDIPF